MIYLVTASKDSTVYSLDPEKNTGRDSILTVSTAYTANNLNDIARSYIQFNINSLPTYVTASSVIMNLQITEVEQLPLNYIIYANPVETNWEMGLGQLQDLPAYTGSINWNNQPSVNLSISGTQTFQYQDSDINMDIKSIYNYWVNTSNYGLRLAHSESVESSSLNYGYLKFYSKETNTYRQPLLKIGFDDQEYNTGSLSSITTNKDIVIKSKGLKAKYPLGKLVQFNFVTRDKFPVKKFSNIFAYESMQYLPQASYYSIKDVITGLKIIDFGDYTKLSCNISGSYVKLDTTNFPTNRPLKFEFLINRGGVFENYEDDLTFEIV